MSNTRKEKVGCFVIARNCYCGYLQRKMFSIQFLVCVQQNSVPLGWSMGWSMDPVPCFVYINAGQNS